MYAVIETGGKQYRVEPGSKLRVDKLGLEPGSRLELPVLLLAGESVQIGSPALEGAKVVAEVLGHGRARKVNVVKFKAKTGYHRKRGHRQPYSEIQILEVTG
jgi:large subunit ribosomal protein L21